MKRSCAVWPLLLTVAFGCTREVQVLAPYPAPRDAGGVAGRDGGPALPELDGGATGPARPDAGAPGDEIDASSVPVPNTPSADGGGASADGAMPLFSRDFSALAAFSHSCAIHAGALYCWGSNEFGQLGGVDEMPVRPRASRLSDGPFTALCAGERHSCALHADGTVSCWGDNGSGELGVGDRVRRNQPTQLALSQIEAVACGGKNSCALTNEGALFCWGDNLEGKLAQGSAIDAAPLPVAVAPEQRFAQVSVGQGHVCALDLEGALFCWGRNSDGQLGIAEPNVQAREPLAIAPTETFASVSAAQRHTCAIDSGGRLYCWGDNRERLLALPEPGIIRTPTQVGSESDHAEVSAGWFHTCTRKSSGALLCWGRNLEGQLGVGDTGRRVLPTQVGEHSDWGPLSLGQFHSCGLRAGALYCWGVNEEGQLGLDDLMRRYVPTAVPLW